GAARGGRVPCGTSCCAAPRRRSSPTASSTARSRARSSSACARAWTTLRARSTRARPRVYSNAGPPRRAPEVRRPLVVEAEVEGLLEIGARVRAEGDVRLRADDALDLGDLVRDDLGEPVVLAHAHDGDQVDVTGDGVDLTYPGDLGNRIGDLGDAVGDGVDQDDGREHGGLPRVGPGSAPSCPSTASVGRDRATHAAPDSVPEGLDEAREVRRGARAAHRARPRGLARDLDATYPG